MHALKQKPLKLAVLSVLCTAAACGSASGGTKTPSTTSAEAATTTTFVSSWKSPTARPLQTQGAKVAAVVIMSDVASRRSAEDKLASEITARGAVGVPMYSLVDQANVDGEPIVREALEKEDVKGVIVLHPSAVEKEAKPQADYGSAPYNSYWAGYYAYGWASPWEDTTTPTYQSVVSVETLIYSLSQNQLVWAGRSKTTNPSTLNDLISEVAAATATELGHSALISQTQ